jgi:hypothetical protein
VGATAVGHGGAGLSAVLPRRRSRFEADTGNSRSENSLHFRVDGFMAVT